MSSPKPISIHIPASLSQYAKSASSYVSDIPDADVVAVGGLIFAVPDSSDPKSAEPCILLVKRAADGSFLAGLWETPGGACESTDPTVIHSTAREVFEEAGLRLITAVAMVGQYSFPLGDKRMCLKLSFEIMVQEISGPMPLKDIPVEIDPEEHSDYRWVTESEVATDEVYQITSEEQRAVIQKGFQGYNDRMKAMAKQ